MILGIDHIGLATDDPAGAGAFMATLGMRSAGGGIAADYGVACEFWHYPGEQGQPGASASIEIVSPAADDSAISGRLAEQGPGIYHVAFTVDDIGLEMRRLRDQGLVVVDRAPCAGARPGMQVVFLYMGRPVALLIELVQYKRDDPGETTARSG